jgi:hypothetical protein
VSHFPAAIRQGSDINTKPEGTAMETRSITTEVPMVPRMPGGPAQLVPGSAEVSVALFKVTGNGSVPRSTISLVQLHAGQIVGSHLPDRAAHGFLRKAGEPEERITSVASWQDSPYFTGAERAALALTIRRRSHAGRFPDRDDDRCPPRKPAPAPAPAADEPPAAPVAASAAPPPPRTTVSSPNCAASC